MSCINDEFGEALAQIGRLNEVKALADAYAAGEFRHYDTLAAAQAAATAGTAPAGSHVTIYSRAAAGDGGGFVGVVEAADNALYPGGGRIRPVGPHFDPQMWGAPLDSETDSSNAWRASIDYLAQLADSTATGGGVLDVKAGKYRLDSAIVMPSEVELGLGKSRLSLYGDTGFNIGWDTDNSFGSQVSDPHIHGGRIEAHAANATVFKVQNSYAPRFNDINLRLLGAGQTGFSIKGNAAPYLGPYYGTMDNIRIFGNGSPGDGQYGMRFFGADTSGSDGVNRWCLSNLRHISSVDYGIDFVNAHGLVVNNVNFEACYTAAARFNARAADYTGTVTTAGDTSSFADSAFVADGDFNSAVIIFNSGPNAGYSANINYVSGSTIYIAGGGAPYAFTIGDSFTLYKSKARSIRLTNVTCETADTIAHFDAGARGCRMEFAFATIASGSNYFIRNVEDISNTIARRYDTFTFEGAVPPGGGEVWLAPTHIASNRGGVFLPETGWLDAVLCTGSTRNVGAPGTITVETFAGGISQGAALSPVLTPDNPFRGKRVRKSLTSSQFIRDSYNIKVRATGTDDLVAGETIRAELYVGYL